VPSPSLQNCLAKIGFFGMNTHNCSGEEFTIMTNKLKVAFGVALLLLTLVTAAGCGRQAVADQNDPSPRKKLEAVKPNEDDGAIYSTTKKFINALVADDRETLLTMLTSEHRSAWRDESFLVTDAAKAQFDEIALENLNYTIVKYVNNEETNFENTGMIFAVYDVVMKNDGLEEGRLKLQESLIFRKENNQWLISLDERGFLVEKN
jgi:triphosphoribosyl-dephospho-CoA synthetase